MYRPEKPSPDDDAAIAAIEMGLQFDELIGDMEGRNDRVQATIDELGPDIPADCMGTHCPIIGELSFAHRSLRQRVAEETENIRSKDKLLKAEARLDECRRQLFETVWDRVTEGSMTQEDGDDFMDLTPLDEGSQSEPVIHSKIAVSRELIEEYKAKIHRIEELYERLGIKPEFPKGINGVSVFIRKSLRSKPRDDECFGSKYDPNATSGFKSSLCTNPAALDALYAAIDEGLLVLDKYHQHLDQRNKMTEEDS